MSRLSSQEITLSRTEINELFRQALACAACDGLGCIWPNRGHAMTCKVCEPIRATIREHHNPCESMDLETQPGERVMFATPTNGWSGDVKQGRLLEIGAEYTVARVTVYDSSSTVELVEVPGVRFNTVQFQNVDEPMDDATRYTLGAA